LAETANASTDSQGTLSARFHGHKPKWLITRRYQCKLRSAEDTWWQRSELGSIENPPWKQLGDLSEFKSGEFTMQIYE
jgi:hypothetical protein